MKKVLSVILAVVLAVMSMQLTFAADEESEYAPLQGEVGGEDWDDSLDSNALFFLGKERSGVRFWLNNSGLLFSDDYDENGNQIINLIFSERVESQFESGVYGTIYFNSKKMADHIVIDPRCYSLFRTYLDEKRMSLSEHPLWIGNDFADWVGDDFVNGFDYDALVNHAATFGYKVKTSTDNGNSIYTVYGQSWSVKYTVSSSPTTRDDIIDEIEVAVHKHSYSNSVCTECGAYDGEYKGLCDHIWSDYSSDDSAHTKHRGTCYRCCRWIISDHYFEHGICIVCFDKKPSSTPGDLNGDGEIDITDSVLLLRYLVGINDGSINEAAADYNGDGEVDSLDSVMLLRHLVGLN